MHQGSTCAVREVPDGGLMVSAPQDGHELGFIEVDHVLERLLVESHAGHAVKPFLASLRGGLLLLVASGLAYALSVA